MRMSGVELEERRLRHTSRGPGQPDSSSTDSQSLIRVSEVSQCAGAKRKDRARESQILSLRRLGNLNQGHGLSC
eukprot:2654731-Rhodomonas_salina.2